MKVDLVYLSWNRLEFTRLSFQTIIQHTNWDLVRRLIVYEDGSTDGTREWLDENLARVPVPHELVHLGFGSPVSTMNHYLLNNAADLWVKLDNDIVVPPGWLETLTQVAEDHPEVELLGMEAGQTWLPTERSPEYAGWDGRYGVRECSWIGGVGLLRTSAFKGRRGMTPIGRFGFTKWQQIEKPVRGWVEPDLLVPQLDRIPEHPFTDWSDKYLLNGWQRHWPPMDAEWGRPYWEWLDPILGRGTTCPTCGRPWEEESVC